MGDLQTAKPVRNPAIHPLFPNMWTSLILFSSEITLTHVFKKKKKNPNPNQTTASL